MSKHSIKDEQFLVDIGAQPLPAVVSHSIEELLSKPEYSALAYEVSRRRGSQTRFYHIVTWQMSHWWDLQTWMNQTQWNLEQLFGPIVRLATTQKQVHGGKVHLLAFYEIGPILPITSPLEIGSAWRTFLAGR
jgi:hypothetical protein